MKQILLLILALPILTFTACSGDDDGPSIELPQIVQDYLNDNYSGFEIEEAELETLCSGSEAYEIEMEGANDEEFEVVINNEGAFLYEEYEIEVAELPIDISDALVASYADYSIEEADRLDLADGSTQFEVEIKSSSSNLEVLFDASGAVLCEEEVTDDD